MTDDSPVIVCAGGASWELPLLRGLQRPELGVRVVRRCVDHGELLGTALRDRPRAVVLDAALGWLDRDLVAHAQAVPASRSSAVGVAADGPRRHRRDRRRCRRRTPTDLAQVLDGARSRGRPPTRGRIPATAGRAVGSSRSGAAGRARPDHGRGAPRDRVGAARTRARCSSTATRGRRRSRSCSSSTESPSVAQAARLAAHGWPTPLDELPAAGPDGLPVLAGLPACGALARGAPEAWRAVLDGGDGDVRHGGRRRRGADRGGRGARRRPAPVPPQPHDDHRARPRRLVLLVGERRSGRAAARRHRPPAAGRSASARRAGAVAVVLNRTPRQRSARAGLLARGRELGRRAAGRAAPGRADVRPRGLGGPAAARGRAAFAVAARAARPARPGGRVTAAPLAALGTGRGRRPRAARPARAAARRGPRAPGARRRGRRRLPRPLPRRWPPAARRARGRRCCASASSGSAR